MESEKVVRQQVFLSICKLGSTKKLSTHIIRLELISSVIHIAQLVFADVLEITLALSECWIGAFFLSEI